MSDITQPTDLTPSESSLATLAPEGPNAKDLAIAAVAAAALLVFVVRNGRWLRYHTEQARRWLNDVQRSGKADEWVSLIQKVMTQYRGR